jgi:hypothetical protein
MHKLPIKCKFVKKESGEADENRWNKKSF